jgi:hypothetical protein
MTGECATCVLIEANKSQHAALVSAWDQLGILLAENRELRARLEHAPIEWVTFEDVEARLAARATAVLQGPLKQARSEGPDVPARPPAVREPCCHDGGCCNHKEGA